MSRTYKFDEIKQAAKDAGLDRQHRHDLYSSLPAKAEEEYPECVVVPGQVVKMGRKNFIVLLSSYHTDLITRGVNDGEFFRTTLPDPRVKTCPSSKRSPGNAVVTRVACGTGHCL